MATDALMGMFGPSPYDVEQARNQQALDYAAKVAMMNNIQQAKFGIGQGAAGIARAGAGMFGLVDPKVEEARRTQEVLSSGGDLTTSRGLKEKAAQFAQAGDSTTAMKLMILARKQEQEEVKMAIEARKQNLAEERQKHQEDEGMKFKWAQLNQQYELAKERAADSRLAASERVAAQRDANQIRLMIAQMAQENKQQQKKSLSATAQKELFEADEAVMGARAGVKALDEALKINKSAMGFKGAGVVADVGSILPDVVRPKKFDATLDLDNIVQQSVLPQLKSIFGANPTEGERKILLEVAGSSSRPANVREKIFERAKIAADNRAKFNAEKAAKLRSGEYFGGAQLEEQTVPEVQSGAQVGGWSIRKK